MGKNNRYFIDQNLAELIAQRCKELRKKHNHSQEYLIDKVHLDISSYELGNKIPTLMSILKICNFYGITLGDFFAPMNYPAKEKAK